MTEEYRPNDQRQAKLSAKKFGSGMMALAWLTLFGLMLLYFQQEERKQFNPNHASSVIQQNGQRVLQLKANRSKHYVMTGKINGRQVPLILDTGATNVAVPANMAQSLKLRKGRKGTAFTANGSVEVFATNIESLEIGEILLTDVEAEINPGMNGLDGILLGMSALSQIEFSVRDGILTIIQ